MNYAQYLQQGGTAQPSIEDQVAQLVQAAMSGDQEAKAQIEQIMQAAQQGDPKAQQLAQLIQQIAQKLQSDQHPSEMKCGGKVRAKIKKACGGKKMGKGGETIKKSSCPCTLKKVGGKLIEVDCNGIPVAKNGAVLYAEPGDKMPDMKLPSRSFGDTMRIKWDNFKNGVKDFAYDNMLGEVLGWSPALRRYVYNDPGTSAEEAMAAMIMPGEGLAARAVSSAAGKAAVLAANTAGKKAVGRATSAIKRGTVGAEKSIVKTSEPYWQLVQEGKANKAPNLEDARRYMEDINPFFPDRPMTESQALLQLRRDWNFLLLPASEREIDAYLHSVGRHINGALYKQGGSLNYAQYLNLK